MLGRSKQRLGELQVPNITLIPLPSASNSNSPWRIGTLKYLETEIEKGPNSGNRSSGTKPDQSGPNRVKWGERGPNEAKRG